MNEICNGEDVRYSKERILEFLEDIESDYQRIGISIDELVGRLKRSYDYTVELERNVCNYLAAVSKYAHSCSEYLKKGDEITGTNQQGTDQQDSD